MKIFKTKEVIRQDRRKLVIQKANKGLSWFICRITPFSSELEIKAPQLVEIK